MSQPLLAFSRRGHHGPGSSVREPRVRPRAAAPEGALRVWMAPLPLLVAVPLAHAGMGSLGRLVAIASGLVLIAGLTSLGAAAWRPALRVVLPPATLAAAAVAIQLVPVPAGVLLAISPRTLAVAEAAPRTQFYPEVALGDLGLGGDLSTLRIPAAERDLWTDTEQAPARGWHPLSVAPSRSAAFGIEVGAWALLLAAFTALCADEGRRSRLLSVLAASAVIVAAANLAVALLGLDAKVFPGVTYRTYGTFVNRNHFGAWCVLAMPPLLAKVWQLSRGDGSSRAAIYGRVGRGIFLGTGAATVLAAGLFSRSRASALALGALLVVCAFVAARALPRGRWVAALACAFVLLAALAMDRGRFLERFQGERLVAGALAPRLEMVERAVGAGRAFLLFGTGFDCLGLVLEVEGLQSHYVFDHLHNEYVELALEGGLAGTILLGAALALLLRRLHWRSDPSLAMVLAGLLAVAVLSLGDFPLRTNAVAVQATASLGILLGAGLSARAPRA